MKKPVSILISILIIVAAVSCSPRTQVQEEADQDFVRTQIAQTVMAEWAATETLVPEPTAESISVDEGLFSVEITLPASMFSDIDMTSFNADEYAREYRFNKASVNVDGSITVWMSKNRHSELLADMATDIDKNYGDLVAETSYILGITHNSDYTSVIVDIERSGYESIIDLTPLSIGINAGYYQLFAGIEPYSEIKIRDSASGEVLKTIKFPEDIQQ